jgi:outer membrane autotransporter protein
MNYRESGCSGANLILALTILTSSEQVSAVTLSPGTSATVEPGEPAQSWTLNAASLTVNPGGQTLNIFTNAGSSVTLNGASVSATSLRALVLTESDAVINDSTLVSTSNTGLSVVRGVDDTVRGSTATVTNSRITAAGRGLNVSGGSTARVIGSQITGTGAVGASVAGDGLGISIIGGEALLEGSQATGSTRGAGVFSNTEFTTAPHLVLDASTLSSGTGSAILVGNLGATPMNAAIEVLNGSTLNAGNGVLLEVGLATSPAGSTTGAVFTVDDSDLTGNIQALAGSTADIVMLNGATLTGTMSNISSLDMNASSVTGNLVELSGSTAPVSMAVGSSFTGSMTNIGSLNIDNSQMTGDIVQDAQTPAYLTLTNGGRLTGTVTGARSLSVGTNSTFDMVNDSNVGALTMGGGTVNLRGGNGAFRTLNASTLAGNGTFAMGTDLAGHLSDLVNITGQASGSHALSIRNTGVDPIEETYAQQVVHTGSGPATFSVVGGQVDVGTFVYRLEQRGTNWYLAQARTDTGGGGEIPVDPGEPGGGGEIPVDPGEPGGGGEIPVDPGEPGGGGETPVDPGGGGETPGGDPIISPSARAVIGIFSAAPTVWYGELSTLRSRMGELRNGNEGGGFWARSYGNKYNVSAQDQVHYSQIQQGVSLGVDTAVQSDGKWLIGVLGGYSRSDLDMRLGTDGEVDSYYAGVYSTWLSDSGYYVDAIIKANRFRNKADVRMSDGVKAKGNYDNHGVGGSVEVGKHIDWGDGWFVEPYGQASALWVSGEDYSLDNGLQARSNNADSLLGKVGTHVGRKIPIKSGGFVQPYVKVALAHEFARSNEVRVNRTTFSDDLSGSRGELGAGIAAQITEVMQLHADVDYGTGKNIDQPWGVNVGLRYVW